MTSHRYVPRSFTLDPLDFGRPGVELRWRTPPETVPEIDQYTASQVQHHWAVRIRAAVERAREYSSVKDFAAANGFDYAKLSRVLRGENVMRLDDIAAARRTLLNSSFTAPSESS